MFANHLSYAQRRSLSNSLVWVTALTAVLTVAAPTLLPCPVAHGKGHILGDDEAEHAGDDKDDVVDQHPQPKGTVACLAAANWCPMSMFGGASRSRITASQAMPKVCVAWPKTHSARDSVLLSSGFSDEEVIVR